MDDNFADLNEQGKQAAQTHDEVNKKIEKSTVLARQFGSAMVGAFRDIAVKGKGLGDVFRSLTLSLSRMVLQAAFKPLEKAAGNLLSGVFSSATGFAKGGVFQRSMPVPFAKGGVISSPIAFPLGGGSTGIAGEAGAEAILPLSRGRDGRLGVRAQGGSAVQVTFNVTTPDAESFRRSETQVAAMLARAVGAGQRNL